MLVEERVLGHQVSHCRHRGAEPAVGPHRQHHIDDASGCVLLFDDHSLYRLVADRSGERAHRGGSVRELDFGSDFAEDSTDQFDQGLDCLLTVVVGEGATKTDMVGLVERMAGLA
jgi:hypothetical protein